MRASKRKVEGRSCACGNPDQDKLATCSNCGAQEHIYCMLIPQRVVPRVWQCGDCVAFRAAPSTSPRKIIPPIRKHNSQNGKVKCIDDEEASRLHGRRWGGSSAHNGFIIPPNKKPYAYKGNKFSSRLPKVSPEPPNKVKRTCSPPSEFSKKNSYAFQRDGLFSRLQEVPPEPPVKMRRNNSPPSSFSKPLHSRNNVHLRSDQALKDRKDKYPEDPIVGQLAEEALVHENGAELSNMITADPVAEESPKPMPPNYLSPINDSDTLVQRPLEYVSKGTPMERCLLQEEFEAASQKAGGDVHGVSHEFQQLGNLVIPKCSPSTIVNHLPRITNFPPLPSESATWTGMFIFSDPAIPGDCYGMFEAYPPSKVHRTAYEYSGFLNDELLVDLIPLSELSPYLLRNDSWNYWDSALYIIPDCTQTRSVQAYHRLLRVMLTQEVVMKSSVDGGVELLIFTSKHLHLDAKRSSERVYLCAVFYDVLSYNDKV